MHEWRLIVEAGQLVFALSWKYITVICILLDHLYIYINIHEVIANSKEIFWCIVPIFMSFLNYLPGSPNKNNRTKRQVTTIRLEKYKAKFVKICKHSWYFRISTRASSHAHKMCLFNPGISGQMLCAMGSIFLFLCP